MSVLAAVISGYENFNKVMITMRASVGVLSHLIQSSLMMDSNGRAQYCN